MEYIESLTSKLRDGDASVINEIIECHISIVKEQVKYHARKFPNAYNDVMGVAMLTLTEVVHRAASGLVDNNITPYIMKRINGAIIDFTVSLPLVRIPRKSFIKDITIPPKIYSYHAKITDNGNIIKVQDIESIYRDDVTSVLGVVDELNLTEEQRTILKHKEEGCTEREIGKKIGKTQQWVNLTIKEIRVKYRRIYDGTIK